MDHAIDKHGNSPKGLENDVLYRAHLVNCPSNVESNFSKKYCLVLTYHYTAVDLEET